MFLVGNLKCYHLSKSVFLSKFTKNVDSERIAWNSAPIRRLFGINYPPLKLDEISVAGPGLSLGGDVTCLLGRTVRGFGGYEEWPNKEMGVKVQNGEFLRLKNNFQSNTVL